LATQEKPTEFIFQSQMGIGWQNHPGTPWRTTVTKSNGSAIDPVERIENAILFIRDQKVMLDADLAKLYGVAPKD